jgi:probable rRNA maturation factor
LEVEIVNRQRGRRVSVSALDRFLRATARELATDPAAAMTICLVSDRRMRELNRRFREIDRPTDVLAFPGDSGLDAEGRRYLGDVVIAVPTAERQARERGHAPARELKLLALHGFLHLLGHDHEKDGGRMNRLEARLRRRLLPGPSRRPGR